MTEQIKPPDLDDRIISDVVRSVRYKIPYAVDERVKAAIIKPPLHLLWFRLSFSAAVLAVLVIAVFFFQPYFKDTVEPVSSITEIKTQFELKDSNIKILWVQKKDFKLRRRQE